MAQTNSAKKKWYGARQISFLPLHPAQAEISTALGQYNHLRCGRRFGKTALLEAVFGMRAIEGRKVGWFADQYKLISPTFTRLRKALLPMVSRASRIDMAIELYGGGRLEFWTLDNEDAGRSRDYDDVVIDEASLKERGLQAIVEQAIMPTLVDRNGTLTLAGTPKEVDPESYFYMAGMHGELGFKRFHAPTWLNPHLSAQAVADLKLKYPPLVYQQEFCAEFVDWSGQAFFSIDSLTVNGQGVEPPTICDAIVGIDTATKTGSDHDGTAMVIAAYTRWPEPRLVILDWDIIQIEGSLLELWLPGAIGRAEGYAQQCRARHGFIGMFIEDKASGEILLQQGRRRGMKVRPIKSELTAMGKEERAIDVSGYVYRGWVKLAKTAFDKEVNYKGDRANHLRRQVIGFRVGNKEAREDDLLDAFTYSLSVTLGDRKGF